MEDRTEQKAALAKRLRGLASSTVDDNPTLNSETRGMLELAAELLTAPPASRENSCEIAPNMASSLFEASPGRARITFEIGEQELRLQKPWRLAMLLQGLTLVDAALTVGYSTGIYPIAGRVEGYRAEALEHIEIHGRAQSDPLPVEH